MNLNQYTRYYSYLTPDVPGLVKLALSRQMEAIPQTQSLLTKLFDTTKNDEMTQRAKFPLL